MKKQSKKKRNVNENGMNSGEHRTRVVGITGGIGSGKSVVAETFEKKGAMIINADRLAKEILWKESAIHDRVVKAFGTEICDDNGIIDKDRLADVVFTGKESIDKLNTIVHPEVIRIIRGQIDSGRQTGRYPLIAVEAALIYEAKIDSLFDCMISVIADREMRIGRIMKRDGVERTAVEKRMYLQIDQETHREKSDFVIENNGTVEELVRGSEAVFDRIVTSS
ncbi:dephospho-CoA kinase [candidate division KSB1 bacterium]